MERCTRLFLRKCKKTLFCLEIKGSESWGREGAEALHTLLQKYPGYQDRVVVSTFHDEVEDELHEKYGELFRGGATMSSIQFVATTYLGVNLFDDSDFACLQTPAFYYVKDWRICLMSKALIRQAHRRNVAVQCWTINDPSEMRKLIKLDVDCIMTDDPALLKQILEEYR